MDPNDTASKMEAASAALAELFDEELRAMGGTDIASIEDRMLGLGHKAMACALGRALEAYGLRICAQLPEGAKTRGPRATRAGALHERVRPRAGVLRARLRGPAQGERGWHGRRNPLCCRRRWRHGRHQRVKIPTINFTPSRPAPEANRGRRCVRGRTCALRVCPCA